MKKKTNTVPMLNINILDAMSRAFNTPIEKIGVDLCSEGRQRYKVDYRKAYAYVRKLADNVTFKQIAHEMGGYDHSSIVHLVNKAQEQIDIKSVDGMIFHNALEFYLKDRDHDIYNENISDIKTLISDFKASLRHDDLNAKRNALRAKIEELNRLITKKSIIEKENERATV